MPKIIFSRKGFDSTCGKGASAIMPNGDLISFPIPEENGIPYSDLQYQKENKSYELIMKELGLTKHNCNTCHLDPDLIRSVYPREKGWHGIFGQAPAAAGHLDKEKVGAGDIFLFFGSYKRTYLDESKTLHYERDYERHIIFGFLRIGAIYKKNDFHKIQAIYAKHPHLQNQENTTSSYTNNTVYVAHKKEDYGVFKYHKDLVLTREGFSKSFWKLPGFFFEEEKIGMTYHKRQNFEKRIKKVAGKDIVTTVFKTVGQGQEFVVSEHPKVVEWAEDLIAKSTKIE